MLLAIALQLRVLVGRQLLAGEDDDRQIAPARDATACARSSSKPVMSGSRRSTTQHSNGRSFMHLERLGAGADGRDLDVVVHQQLDDALPLDVVVLDTSSRFLCGADVAA